ncbi:MAG: hypothetical protein D6707_10630, partial [Bacteroidetes bacterium]
MINSYSITYTSLKQFVPLTDFFKLACFIPFPSLKNPVLALSNYNFISNLTHIKNNDFWFGAVSYDYKNTIDSSLTSRNTDNIEFPDVCFFKPDVLIWFYSEHEAEVQILNASTEDERIIN